MGAKGKEHLEESGTFLGREAESAGKSRWAEGLRPKAQEAERTLTKRKALPFSVAGLMLKARSPGSRIASPALELGSHSVSHVLSYPTVAYKVMPDRKGNKMK